MTSITSGKISKYKSASILIPAVDVGLLVSGVVAGTVEGEGTISVGKRFSLHPGLVQHSATQRAKTGSERVLFLSLHVVVLQSPVLEEAQPRMPTDVPFVNSAVNVKHLNKRK